MQCSNEECGRSYPVVGEIPVLVNEANSLFSISDFEHQRPTTQPHVSPIIRWVSHHLPDIGANYRARANYNHLKKLLLSRDRKAIVLVVGGGDAGLGMHSILSSPSIEFIETDVRFGSRSQLICDGHDLPFRSGTVDAVIIQAVLEHVLDPFRVVDEIHRVLKDDGLVYAETPFMQQVHGGRFDFTRFTDLGHRRLFRRFEQISSGVLCGPGMALAWAIKYFFLSFVRTSSAKRIVTYLSRLTLFWLKYFDLYLMNKPGSFDSASGYYFLGRKSETPFDDRDLIRMYRGIM
jgi:SAM-dependent methyltransferase